MSIMSEAVEWSYKDLKQMCTINYFGRSFQVRQALISLFNNPSTFLLNSTTYIENGGKVGPFFNFTNPTLNDSVSSQLYFSSRQVPVNITRLPIWKYCVLRPSDPFCLLSIDHFLSLNVGHLSQITKNYIYHFLSPYFSYPKLFPVIQPFP